MVSPHVPSAAVRLAPPPRALSSSSAQAGRALLALTKPRLAAISVLTTLASYAAARPGFHALEFLSLLTGTAGAAAGALSFNQWAERRADARMLRTRKRPLPAGEVTAERALKFSLGISLAGLVTLGVGVNPATALLAATTIVLYGGIYTPLKRRTRWATEVGAVSGALPALMGNSAAGDLWAAPGVVLAAVLWCWQMPHFFALGWHHRLDYRAAGFPLLPAIDAQGARTAAWSLAYSALLLAVSLAPCALGSLGLIYGVCAAGTGLYLLHRAWHFWRDVPDRDGAARRLFTASLVTLPVLMLALVLDQLGPW